MAHILYPDIWDNIIDFLQVADVFSLMQCHRSFPSLIAKKQTYKNNTLLVQLSDFIITEFDRKLLDFHLMHKFKKIDFYADDIIYYTMLCTKHGIFLDILEHILVKACELKKTEYNIVNTIIQNAKDIHVIELIKKNYIYTIDDAMIKYCHDYDILYWYIHVKGNMFFQLMCHHINSLVSSYNCNALHIILEHELEHWVVPRIIEKCDHKLWLDGNTQFRTILYNHVKKTPTLLTIFANEMLLYYCAKKSGNDIKSSILNDPKLLSTLDIVSAVNNGVANNDGYQTILWLDEQNCINFGIDTIIKVYTKMIINGDYSKIEYWKTKYSNEICHYYSHLSDDKINSCMTNLHDNIEMIIEYFDPNKVLSVIGQRCSRSYRYGLKITNTIHDTLYKHLDFNKIDEQWITPMIFWFLRYEYDTFFRAYLVYQSDVKKKITFLINLLQIIDKYGNNVGISREICVILTTLYDI